MFILAAIVLLFSTANAGNFASSPQPFHPYVVKKAVPPVFGYFRAHRMQRDASLNWMISDPSAVDHFEIERSEDGEIYVTIDDNVLCDGDATHKYRDANCFPGTIYYRINAHLTDGTIITSPIEVVKIVVKHG